MFGIFRKKNPSVVIVTLNARLQPMDRAELEDAFDAVMTQEGHGIRVVGGGTLLTPEGEVSECDIEIEVDALSDKAIGTITHVFTAMLAPKGSRLQVTDPDRRVEFGGHEGLALYLNGTELPDEVYAEGDSTHVYNECIRLLEGIGTVHSHWQGPQETALYMYGSDFKAMHERLIPFLESYPLCQKCRVVRIA